VNCLASDGHIRELVCHLQLVGEVLTFYAFCEFDFIYDIGSLKQSKVARTCEIKLK